MGLPSATEAADEEAAGGLPRAAATWSIEGCLLAAACNETPATESWIACSPAERIRVAASVVTLFAQRMDELVMRGKVGIRKKDQQVLPFMQSDQTVVTLLLITNRSR